MKVIVVSGRSLMQGAAKEKKFSDEYMQVASTCEVDPEDLAQMGVQPGQNVELTTKWGSVVLKAIRSSQPPHRGIVFVVYGPWVNVLMDSGSDGTGMPTLKGITAEIRPGGEALDLKGLLRRITGERP